MTIEITYGATGLQVHGDHLVTMPEPGFPCPQCDLPTRWVQGLPGERTIVSYRLPLCGHEFSARRWELVRRDETWALEPRVLSQSSWSDDRLQAWEDTINATFRSLGSSERVCAHLNLTGTQYGSGSRLVECDYCPASAFVTDPQTEAHLPPHYYLDPVPV